MFDRPRRLAFTWSVPKHARDVARVGIDIRPRDDGSDITLTHELLPQYAEYADRTKKSWGTMIDAIARLPALPSNLTD